MKNPHKNRLELGLKAALDELRALPKNASEDLKWISTSNVLDWLYRCEEAERQADSNYYQHRDSSPEGRALAGLIWKRGQNVHCQSEVQDQVMLPVKIVDYRGQPVKILDWQGNAVAVISCNLRWPKKSKLPIQVPDKHGRDIHYETYVQDRELLQPLEQAVEYVLSR
jgi:hypothetical protein